MKNKINETVYETTKKLYKASFIITERKQRYEKSSLHKIHALFIALIITFIGFIPSSFADTCHKIGENVKRLSSVTYDNSTGEGAIICRFGGISSKDSPIKGSYNLPLNSPNWIETGIHGVSGCTVKTDENDCPFYPREKAEEEQK